MKKFLLSCFLWLSLLSVRSQTVNLTGNQSINGFKRFNTGLFFGVDSGAMLPLGTDKNFTRFGIVYDPETNPEVTGFAPTAFTFNDQGVMIINTSPSSEPRYEMKRARGTLANPQSVQSGDLLGRILFAPYNVSKYSHSVSMMSVMTGTTDNLYTNANLIFNVRKHGNKSEWFLDPFLELNPDGNIYLPQVPPVASGGYDFLARNTQSGAIERLSSSAISGLSKVREEGVENMAIGNSVLEVNTGFENVGIGERALRDNTTGTENTAVGVNAIISNTTGSGNTALGNYVMTRLTAGSGNVAIGQNALNNIVLGGQNVAIGYSAGYNLGNENNTRNILIGYGAGANWQGQAASWHGSNNFILGSWSPSSGTVMNNTMVFATGNGVERYRISENGNLLLGTSSENHADRLQVQGSILAMASEQREVQSYLPDQYTTGDIVSGHAYKWYSDTWRLGNIRSGAMPSDGFGISFNHALQFKISSSGNVGIGVDTPGEKLSVNGNIKAKAVKVDPNAWPDYVFEPDYSLPSLKETEHFINTNKHLPGVPSAKEVESKGIDLGDMSAVLLKKIEELTLHQIELEKKLKGQEMKIEAQEEVIRKLLVQ